MIRTKAIPASDHVMTAKNRCPTRHIVLAYPGFPSNCYSDPDCSEKGVTSPDELMAALKRYLEQCGKTEQVVASQIGVNRHTLARWLSDNQSPKKGKLALTAFFLRRAGYL